jgi:hypothetical protein
LSKRAHTHGHVDDAGAYVLAAKPGLELLSLEEVAEFVVLLLLEAFGLAVVAQDVVAVAPASLLALGCIGRGVDAADAA